MKFSNMFEFIKIVVEGTYGGAQCMSLLPLHLRNIVICQTFKNKFSMGKNKVKEANNGLLSCYDWFLKDNVATCDHLKLKNTKTMLINDACLYTLFHNLWKHWVLIFNMCWKIFYICWITFKLT